MTDLKDSLKKALDEAKEIASDKKVQDAVNEFKEIKSSLREKKNETIDELKRKQAEYNDVSGLTPTKFNRVPFYDAEAGNKGLVSFNGFFSWTGRLDRKSYVFLVVCLFILTFMALMAAAELEKIYKGYNYHIKMLAWWFVYLVGFIFVASYFALGSKRLHDMGKKCTAFLAGIPIYVILHIVIYENRIKYPVSWADIEHNQTIDVLTGLLLILIVIVPVVLALLPGSTEANAYGAVVRNRKFIDKSLFFFKINRNREGEAFLKERVRELFWNIIQAIRTDIEARKTAAIVGAIVLFVVFGFFMARPTVGKVENFKAEANVEELRGIIKETEKSEFYVDVRKAAIRALFELESEAGETALEEILLGYHSDEEARKEVNDIRKNFINDSIAKDSGYVDKTIYKYIERATKNRNTYKEEETYKNLVAYFEGFDSDVKKKISKAVILNSLKNIDTADRPENPYTVKGRLGYLTNHYKEYIPEKYIDTINKYFQLLKDWDSMDKRIKEISQSIQSMIEERKNIENAFNPRNPFRIDTDEIIRREANRIYITQGQNAAIEYLARMHDAEMERIKRYNSIPNEIKKLQEESEFLTNRKKSLPEYKKALLEYIQIRAKREYLELYPKLEGAVLGQWTDKGGNVKINLTDSTLNDAKIIKVSYPRGYNETYGYCIVDVDGKNFELKWDLENPDWQTLCVDNAKYYRISNARNYTNDKGTFNNFKNILKRYVRGRNKKYANSEISLVSAKERESTKYKGLKIIGYNIKIDGNEESAVIYEKNGIIWQILSRNVCDRLLYCADEKVYRSAAFIYDGKRTLYYGGEPYEKFAWDLATEKYKVHPDT